MDRQMRVEEALDLYNKFELTPLLIVLGGSRSFNMTDGNMDYDYYGYHREPVELTRLESDGCLIKSYDSNRINDILHHDNAVAAQFCLSNLFWDPRVYADKRFMLSVSTSIGSDLGKYAFLFMEAADLLKDGIYKDGEFDKTEKHWTRWLRILLTGWYLQDTGELNCDFHFLTRHYGLEVKELYTVQDVYDNR